MIITRTPFRISFAGGGSDIPAFYEKHSGCVLSTTINKYMYISVHPSFIQKNTVLKYSETETVLNKREIKHKYFKAILNKLDVEGVEITSTADIPAGTGLGSSSAFSVGLLHSLYSYKGKFVSKEKLASEACDIELLKLRQPIGKQDQYASAYGGMNFYMFNSDGSVFVEPVIMNKSAQEKLEQNLMLFYIGGNHSAGEILKEQTANISSGEKEIGQLKLCTLAQELKRNLECGNVNMMGEILHEGWEIKRTLATGISNSKIDEVYNIARKNGAIGGKLLGAGGGGFLLLYVPEKQHNNVRNALRLVEMPFSMEGQGSSVIYVGTKPDYDFAKKRLF